MRVQKEEGKEGEGEKFSGRGGVGEGNCPVEVDEP